MVFLLEYDVYCSWCLKSRSQGENDQRSNKQNVALPIVPSVFRSDPSDDMLGPERVSSGHPEARPTDPSHDMD